jgi:hypothetical protein
MSETQATDATMIGALPPPILQGWTAPVGLPMPLPAPVISPAGWDLPAPNLTVELTSLPPGWHTLSSERIGASCGFEHIVIGPAGVFTVTTTPHPEGSQFEAARATRLLDQAGLVDIRVQAVLVMLGAELTLHDNSDVIVVAVHDVCRTLQSLPTTLTALQVQSVYNITERRDTWIERAQPKG